MAKPRKYNLERVVVYVNKSNLSDLRHVAKIAGISLSAAFDVAMFDLLYNMSRTEFKRVKQYIEDYRPQIDFYD